MRAVLPAIARPLLAPHLPADLEVTWFATPAEAAAGIATAEIAWVDMQPPALTGTAVAAAGPDLRWVSTIYAGLDELPLPLLRERGIVLTNGAGINAATVAEYAVLGILTAAKRLDQVIRAHDRREWLTDAPGKRQLEGTVALVIGYGTIGRMIGDRLRAFGVAVEGVTRSGRDGTLGPDEWRARLGAADWVVLAAPSTPATKTMIGAGELAAMKDDAWLVNVARGDMVDQDALVVALEGKAIGGAFLDPTDPEPLPADHPLWTAPNTIVTMHLSGRSQTTMFARAAELFLANLAAFRAGAPMRNMVDLDAGY
jgi:phosphoglycerate dehydrogenase-like enzyme